jgi:hypothetical protein
MHACKCHSYPNRYQIPTYLTTQPRPSPALHMVKTSPTPIKLDKLHVWLLPAAWAQLQGVFT